MTRTHRPTAQRREEILDAAHTLFTTKGFQPTTMEDILKVVGIAKGTLYYHFPSKEQILRALVLRIVGQVEQRAREVADSSAPAVDKLVTIMAAMRVEAAQTELVEQFHAPGNAEFHLLSITAMIEHLTPVLADVVAQGVNEGIFTTDRPHDAVELLLSASGILLDHEIMEPSPDELVRRRESLIWASETLLGARPGSLSALVEVDS
ncbi:TetR/AcrR family transcriptional regulator [Actinomyces johnsonii]|uniref:TetR/AcrR family transcriptional regulator n=1 Tax=Actinomyces johnsonii TaxID=544581 RepID=A0A507ZYZ4_9ACTO|nr:TetR/AcrR family transcriptional regulator [Actinomyces johnsonii]KAA8735749.1 TetR/AcrR family transcriptional regulator [Actinomyces johnsonii]TQD42956.1 TetR/AcrR family transcriptional regulator [Actinomyces johnsonii]